MKKGKIAPCCGSGTKRVIYNLAGSSSTAFETSAGHVANTLTRSYSMIIALALDMTLECTSAVAAAKASL